MRTLLLCGLLAISVGYGQEPQDEFVLYKLKAKAAAPPMPSMKYELFPSALDQNTNNAALLYHRALILASETRTALRFGQMQTEVLESFEKPVADAPKEQLRKYVQMYHSTIRELEAAARCGTCDWGTMQRIQEEGIGLLLPEVQPMRELSYALRARARLYAAEGKWEPALRDIQTGLTMAHHIGKGSTFIQFLVGVAIATIFVNELDTVLQVDGCPNMYWSLTAIPRPLIDIRKPIEGELRSMEKTLFFPKDLDKGPMSNEQATGSIEKIFAALNNLNDEPGERNRTLLQSPSYNRLALAGYVTLQYPNAKKALLAAGKTETELDAMPAAQVVMLEAMIQCRNVRDEYFVWINAPYTEGLQGMRKASEQFRDLKKNPIAIPQQMLLLLLPAVEKIYLAEVRVARRIASLRTVEAVRLHVAKTGNLPAKLSDIQAVTLPLDPLTNSAFDYSTEGNSFTVIVNAPPGEKGNRGNSWKYQVTLTK